MDNNGIIEKTYCFADKIDPDITKKRSEGKNRTNTHPIKYSLNGKEVPLSPKCSWKEFYLDIIKELYSTEIGKKELPKLRDKKENYSLERKMIFPKVTFLN